METVLIWGNESNFYRKGAFIHAFEESGDIRVLGIHFRNHVPLRSAQAYGYSYLEENDPRWQEASCVLVCSADYDEEIIAEVCALGVDREKLIPSEMLNMQGFSFTRYMSLVRSRLSILCNVCWGGITYHYFSLPFLSPTINLFINDYDYIRFLDNLPQMLEAEPVYSGTEYNADEKHDYPIFDLCGITLHMNHSFTAEQALADWKRRRTRVNFDNILAVMVTNSVYSAQMFEELPYKKKVCFVPFDTDFPHCISVDPGQEATVNYVNKFSAGIAMLYDPWLLLEEGKCVYLTEKPEVPVKEPDEHIRKIVYGTKHILIYGAWMLGGMAYDKVTKYVPERFLGFAVSSAEGNPEEKSGYPVRTLSDWCIKLEEMGVSRESVLVIMALHPRYYREVEDTLHKREFYHVINFEDMEWVLYEEFVHSGKEGRI